MPNNGVRTAITQPADSIKKNAFRLPVIGINAKKIFINTIATTIEEAYVPIDKKEGAIM
ncbi:hypothetical protein D3C87_2013210 [compost metagenome]